MGLGHLLRRRRTTPSTAPNNTRVVAPGSLLEQRDELMLGSRPAVPYQMSDHEAESLFNGTASVPSPSRGIQQALSDALDAQNPAYDISSQSGAGFEDMPEVTPAAAPTDTPSPDISAFTGGGFYDPQTDIAGPTGGGYRTAADEAEGRDYHDYPEALGGPAMAQHIRSRGLLPQWVRGRTMEESAAEIAAERAASEQRRAQRAAANPPKKRWYERFRK